MKNLLGIVFILFMAGSAWALESAGIVADTQGGSFVTHNGQTNPIRFKQSVYQGDDVETKEDGSVKLLFVDDTILTIKENSKVKITQFLYNSKKRERKGIFNLLKGAMRTVVTQFFGKGEDVEILTRTAVAGIRGTDIETIVQKESTTFHCFDGTVFIFNVAFPEEVITLQKGESITIHQSQSPTEEDVISLPEGVQPSVEMSLPPPESQPTATSEVVKSTFDYGDYSATEYTYDYTPTSDTSSTYGFSSTYGTGPPPDFESTAVSETEAVATTPTPIISATNILPGGASQASNPTTVTITFP